MFYIIKDEKLQIVDDNKEKLETTLELMPQLQDERLLETDIITVEELSKHPNKVLVDDIQIEIDVPDYEEQEITKEIEVPDFETVTKTEEVQVGEDEDGKPIYETKEWQEEIQTGTHVETITETQTIQAGSHKETITVKGLVLNPHYEDEKAQKERERLDKLSMTRGDVFEALILAKGLTKPQIRAMIENAELDDITKALYLNRFDEALNFYRGFPVFNMLGQALGITPKQLDDFFMDGNYEHLLPVTQQGSEEEKGIE